jgi:hypothetical protein
MEVNNEFTMEVKLTLNPLWLKRVQNMIPNDSPQLMKQNTSNMTRKNDPTVSILDAVQRGCTRKSGDNKKQSANSPHDNLEGDLQRQIGQEEWLQSICPILMFSIECISFIRIDSDVVLHLDNYNRVIPASQQIQEV